MNEPRCRGCGRERPSDAPGGLCPACLLRAGLESGSSSETMSIGPPSGLASTMGGGLPHLLLRDTDPGVGPVIQPVSAEMPAAGDRSGRLHLFGEIARGGMGAVLKGRDPDLGRDVAVKVLLEAHRDHPELIRRFVEEAQIGGQLQHPGIVPIYELGAFGDRRPYFAMKLVKGRTLAAILADRPDPSADRPRFLAIFESICQTMAYSHARGVIHRDLKPSNVMVGSFGEVQVMDWGLAKVLPQGGVIDDASAGHETIIATPRADPDADRSQAGSVLGTPAYMAPEQARGEVDRLDERADAFALGSILAEILTGSPAFTGRSGGEIRRISARGDLDPALARLARSAADPDLIALATACLAPELEDRPRHAGIVADRIASHRSGVQDRLRLAEIAAAEGAARADEATKRALVERSRRRLTVALAASLLGLFLLGAGGWTYVSRLRADRRASIARVVLAALDDATLLRGQAKAAPIGDLSRWPAALASAQKASSLLALGEPDAELRAKVDGLLALLEQEQGEAGRLAFERDRDRKFLDRLEAIRLDRSDRTDAYKADAAYAAAFREFGIDVDRLEPTEAGRLLAARSEPMDIAFFIDDWARERSEAKPKGMDATEELNASHELTWRRLIKVAQVVDPDPWRNDLRSLSITGNPEAVRRLAADVNRVFVQPSRSLILLASILRANGEHEKALNVLKRQWRLHPDDFGVCSELSEVAGADATRYATAAVALRPRSAWAWARLSSSLPGLGTKSSSPSEQHKSYEEKQKILTADIVDEAISGYRKAIKLSPEAINIHMQLSVYLIGLGRIEEALPELREAVRLDPKEYGLRCLLIYLDFETGKRDEAVFEAIRIASEDPAVAYSLLPRMFGLERFVFDSGG